MKAPLALLVALALPALASAQASFTSQTRTMATLWNT